MQTLAAVMTGSGTSAIATIEILGPQACDTVTQVFTPYSKQPLEFQIGTVWVGTLHDQDRPIDEVTVGCEGTQHLAIHCHGNPLIVESIMALLTANGITPSSPDVLHASQLAHTDLNLCQQEIKLAQARCKTLLGIRLLNEQFNSGITAWAEDWLNHPAISIETLHHQCHTILDQSRIARHILQGVMVVLIGPPNSGKSTLLNALSGQDAAIVTDIRGTTRDWIEADCRTHNLLLRLVDTAGLDTRLTQQSHLDKAFQQRTLSVIQQADLILFVLDSHDPASRMEPHWLENLPECPQITVLNKSDLTSESTSVSDTEQSVRISAKNETGLNDLISRIEHTLRVQDFNIAQPLCITTRQQQCLESILSNRNRTQIQINLTSLVNAYSNHRI